MATSRDSFPEIAVISPGSVAEATGLRVGDLVRDVNGVTPRDVIEWYHLVDNDTIDLTVVRKGELLSLRAERSDGRPFGAEVSSAVFDRVQTCDNHCEFCFIYQLPKGMRRSLYLKDDDYRLSFLYGNFTTLTRFTEADFERVVSQRLSPLYVSLHATSPWVRAEMLRNPRGGFSLRWAQELMRMGIDVRGQIVLCPGVNDRDELDRTILDCFDNFASLTSVAIVPVGLSKHNTESRMRVHTTLEARRVVMQVERWQQFALATFGRRFVFLADEFYLSAGLPIPARDHYEDFEMLEDGIGLARHFLDSFNGASNQSDVDSSRTLASAGFFASAAARERSSPENPTDYVRNPAGDTSLRFARTQRVSLRSRTSHYSELCVITGECAAPLLTSAIESLGSRHIRVAAVRNEHFGGNTSVTGLLTGHDIAHFIDYEMTHRGADTVYVIPDVCLNGGRFLDGSTIDDLRETRPIEVVPTDGRVLREHIERFLEQRALAVGAQ